MKRVFQVIDKMVKDDEVNSTRLVAISNTLVGAQKTKRGTEVTMGCDDQVLDDLMSNKAVAILVVVDKDEFFKRSTR